MIFSTSPTAQCALCSTRSKVEEDFLVIFGIAFNFFPGEKKKFKCVKF